MVLPDDTARKRKLWVGISVNRVLAAALAVVLLVPAARYSWYRVQATTALREAKNAVLAIQLLSARYQAESSVLYDATQPDGFTAGAADEIQELCGAEGELHLVSWDGRENSPTYLTYSKDRIFVTYTYDPETQETAWEAGVLAPVLRYSD